MNVKTMIPGLLYQGCRPGYYREKTNWHTHKLSIIDVIDDIQEIQNKSIKNILCLMTDREIEKYYNFDLLSLYLRHDFNVLRYPINDNKFMKSQNRDSFFCDNKLKALAEQITTPTYVHCSAGVMRSVYLADKLSIILNRHSSYNVYADGHEYYLEY